MELKEDVNIPIYTNYFNHSKGYIDFKNNTIGLVSFLTDFGGNRI